MTAPDMQAPPARAPRARRQARRDRSAPHPHRRGRRRAPLHPPGTDASCCSRSSTRSSRRSLARPGALAEHGERRRATSRAGAPFAPKPSRRLCGDRRGDDPPARARARRRARAAAVYARIGTCTQEFGTRRAGSSTCSTSSPAISTAGRRDVSARRGRARRTRSARRAAAAASASDAATAACAAYPRCSASCPSPASPRRSRRRATDRFARSGHHRRQPGAEHAERRASRRARSRSSSSW